MRTKKEFYNQITKTVKDGLTTLQDLTTQMRDVEMLMKSGTYSPEYSRTVLRPKVDKLRKQIEDERHSANEKVKKICGAYIEELRAQDDLDPSLLNDDIKLLQAGVTLKPRDITAMLNRNADNHTMTQVILRYCKEHDISTGGVHYVGNQGIIDSVSVVPTVAETSLKWHDKESIVYDRLMGEGSELASAFSEE